VAPIIERIDLGLASNLMLVLIRLTAPAVDIRVLNKMTELGRPNYERTA
jgi:hypothetical protein